MAKHGRKKRQRALATVDEPNLYIRLAPGRRPRPSGRPVAPGSPRRRRRRCERRPQPEDLGDGIVGSGQAPIPPGVRTDTGVIFNPDERDVPLPPDIDTDIIISEDFDRFLETVIQVNNNIATLKMIRTRDIRTLVLINRRDTLLLRTLTPLSLM